MWFLVTVLVLASSVISGKLNSRSFSFFIYTKRVLSKMICKNSKSFFFFKSSVSTLGAREFCVVRFGQEWLFLRPWLCPSIVLCLLHLWNMHFTGIFKWLVNVHKILWRAFVYVVFLFYFMQLSIIETKCSVNEISVSYVNEGFWHFSVKILN